MRSILTTGELAPGLAATAFALVVGPIACGQPLSAPLRAAHPEDAAPVRGGTLHLASYTDIRNLDPAGPSDTLGQQAVHQIFAGLIEYDHHGQLVPDLADHWDIEDDGRTYRFVLRQGVRMHDGEELTADDVKRSAERALHPSAPNPVASDFANISGYEAFTSSKAAHLTGVVVEGRYTVAFHLAERDAAFLPLLTMPTLRPVCKTAGERYVDTWLPCGAGPFRLEPGGWNRGASLRLVRHEGYFRPGLPYLDAIEWTLNQLLLSQRFRFEDGAIDILHDPTQADAVRFRADPRWKGLGAPEGDAIVWGESMNTRVPPFDNIEIRRAVASAIDRSAYVLVRPANMSPQTQLLPHNVPGFDPSLEGQRYDYAAALEHMRRAGYPYDPASGRGGWPESIPYVVTDYSVSFFTAQIAQQQLAKIGLRIALRLVSWPAYLAITQRAGASAMSAQGWAMDYLDASSFFEPLFSTGSIGPESSNNASFYSNPRYDELIARARREGDTAVRYALYREANALLCDEAPWAFTNGQHDFDVRQPYVRGFAAHPVEPLAAREILARPGDRRPEARARRGAPMRRLARRLGWSLFVVWAVVSIAFAVNNLVAGDPARMVAGAQARPADVARLRNQLGLDRPPLVQYALFWKRLAHVGPRSVGDPGDPAHATCVVVLPLGHTAVHADLGKSYQLRQPVLELVLTRLPRTFALALAGIFVQLLLGMGTGVLAALHRNSLLDRALVGASLLGISAPTFLIALVLQYVLAYELRWLPLDGFGATLPEHARCLVLPALTLGIYGAAYYTRLVRDELVVILRQDWVRTARAKGLPGWRVIGSHAIRNALVPIVTAVGLDFGALMGGAIVTEAVFRWPGLGQLSVNAMLNRDGPVILACVIVTSVAIVASNLAVDLLYPRLDPRAR